MKMNKNYKILLGIQEEKKVKFKWDKNIQCEQDYKYRNLKSFGHIFILFYLSLQISSITGVYKFR